MARPTKQGIDYFPVDVEFDDKIELYVMEREAAGLAVLMVLWQQIYKGDGYFIVNSPDLHLRIRKRLNLEMELVESCIQTALARGVFDIYLHDQYGILTSRGVQRRYFEVTSKRKSVKAFNRFILIDKKDYSHITYIDRSELDIPVVVVDNSTASESAISAPFVDNPVNSTETTSEVELIPPKPQNSGINDHKSTQSKVKERKGKERKEEKSKDTCAPTELTCEWFQYFWECYPPRNGKKLYRAETLTRFSKLSPSDQELCVQAVKHYASSDLVRRGMGIKDPPRFIRDGKGQEPWREWMDPEIQTVPQNSKTQRIQAIYQQTLSRLEDD